jgi:hypothetical protein
MNHYLLILLVIILGTIMWPINKLSLGKRGRSEYLGMVISFIAALMSFVVAVISKGNFWNLNAFILGSLTGITYAIGPCVLLFKCLKIGPMGLSVTFNNLGLLWPVVIGMIFFPTVSGVSIPKVIGVIVIVFSMLLLSKYNTNVPAETLNRRWVKLIILAWVFTGISLVTQLLFSIYCGDNLMVYAFYTYFIAFLILLVYNAFLHSLFPLKEEIIGGTLNGVVYLTYFCLVNYILAYVSPTIVFIASTLLPFVLVLIIGSMCFKEKLNKLSKIGIALAIFGFLFIQM